MTAGGSVYDGLMICGWRSTACTAVASSPYARFSSVHSARIAAGSFSVAKPLTTSVTSDGSPPPPPPKPKNPAAIIERSNRRTGARGRRAQRWELVRVGQYQRGEHRKGSKRRGRAARRRDAEQKVATRVAQAWLQTPRELGPLGDREYAAEHSGNGEKRIRAKHGGDKGDKSEAAQSDHAAALQRGIRSSRPRRSSCSGTRCGPTPRSCAKRVPSDKQLLSRSSGSPTEAVQALRDRLGRELLHRAALSRPAYHELARAADGVPPPTTSRSRRARCRWSARQPDERAAARARHAGQVARALPRRGRRATALALAGRARLPAGAAADAVQRASGAALGRRSGSRSRRSPRTPRGRGRRRGGAHARRPRSRLGLEPSNVATLGLDHIGNDRRELPNGGRLRRRRAARRALDDVANHAARCAQAARSRANGRRTVRGAAHTSSRYVTCQSVV